MLYHKSFVLKFNFLQLFKVVYRKSSSMYTMLCKVLLLIFMLSKATYSKTKQDVLEEKVKQLMDWSNRRSVIKMDGARFSNYVKIKPRNYSVMVMFTAINPKRGCSICQDASDEFTLLANSYRFSSSYGNSLFFGVVDFDDGSDIFQLLDLKSAPTFLYFPAKKKFKSLEKYDIERQGYHADNIAKWLGERTGFSIRVLRPPNYMGTIVLILIFTVAGALIYLRRDNLEFFYNKTFWGILSIFVVLAMTSGQMWNHIRAPPYYHRNPHNGAFSYINGNSRSQYIAESHLVMLINAAIVVGFILLNEIHNPEADATKKKVMAGGGLLVVVFFFSLLLSIFRRKYQGYPYSLFLR